VSLDVNYIWGVYYAQSNDWAHAQVYWEKAIQIYPRHAFVLGALGRCSIRNGDFLAAIGFLEGAVEAAPSWWHFEAGLAEAYLLQNEYDQARKHAEHSIELGKDRASSAQLVLARALLQQNQPQLAEKALNTILAQPSNPAAWKRRSFWNA